MKLEIPHTSFSSANGYNSCERSWYLGKVKQAEEAIAWFSMIGTAVHDGIEHYLKKGTKLGAEELFYPLVEKALLIEPDMSQWLSGGSKSDPIVEDKAEARFLQCLDAAYEYLEQVDVWAIEWDATGMLPGCDVPVKGFIDIVGEHRKHGPSIIDWKSGSTKPKSPLQLQTYKALIMVSKQTSWINVNKGLYVMLLEGTSKPRPIDLSMVDPQEIGRYYGQAVERQRQGIVPYRPQFMCNYCFQAPNCALQSGKTERTDYYDTPEAEGLLPF